MMNDPYYADYEPGQPAYDEPGYYPEVRYQAAEIASPLSGPGTYYETAVRDTSYDLAYPPQTLAAFRQPADVVQQRMTIIMGVVVFLVVLFAMFRLNATLHLTDAVVVQAAPPAAAVGETAGQAETVAVSLGAGGAISPVFAPSVQYWADQIVAWSNSFGIDPNLAATIMQIESCGDPQAVSRAGAQGLFQVMPFHFTGGENMLDPDTNARRGLNYFVERLAQTNGDIGKAFAGYNGGQRAAAGSWSSWPSETQRYFVWSTGIYDDIQQGLTESPTLKDWLAAGGSSLCAQAARRVGIQ